jgi:hypothetical protein
MVAARFANFHTPKGTFEFARKKRIEGLVEESYQLPRISGTPHVVLTPSRNCKEKVGGVTIGTSCPTCGHCRWGVAFAFHVREPAATSSQ